MLRQDNIPLINSALLSDLSLVIGPSELLLILDQARRQLVDAIARMNELHHPHRIEAAAHRLKGSLGSVGFDRLVGIASRIECDSSRAGSWQEDLDSFRQTLTDSLSALEVLLAEYRLNSCIQV
jgi:HPt (histidine-containing phosphotransfer) domain-containing protein